MKLIRILFFTLLILSGAIARAEQPSEVSVPKELHGLRVRALAGNAEAQFDMGSAFLSGQRGGQDYAEAARWFRLAARQGLAQAQYNLGMMHAAGQGVAQDIAEASKWYRLAAAQGLALAQLNLGVACVTGQGELRNEAEAVKWFRLAAIQGEAQAQFNLGVMYANGQGVPQNLTEAYRWARLAADQHHEIAKSLVRDLLGRMSPEQQARALGVATKATGTERLPAAVKPEIMPDAGRNDATDTTKPTAPANNATMQLLERCVNEWAAAWSDKRVDSYLNAYLPDYRPAGISHEMWKKRRTERLSKSQPIEVTLSEMKVSVQDDRHATVLFIQQYHSGHYRDRLTKTLRMEKRLDRWLIAEEISDGSGSR